MDRLHTVAMGKRLNPPDPTPRSKDLRVACVVVLLIRPPFCGSQTRIPQGYKHPRSRTLSVGSYVILELLYTYGCNRLRGRSRRTGSEVGWLRFFLLVKPLRR